MRIVLVLSSMGAGGAERVAATLANAWVECGHSVLMLATYSGGGQSFYELDARVRLSFLASLTKSRRRSAPNRLHRFLLLRKAIRREAPDVVVSFLAEVNIACVLATIGIKVPLVVCERSDPFSRSETPRLRLARRLTYSRAAALVVQTKSVRRKFLAAGIGPRVVDVIPNPIPARVKDYPWPSRRRPARRILGIGRLDAGKQFDLLIDIFSEVVKFHPDCRLRIVGDGPLRGELEEKVKLLSLEAYVEFRGLVADISEELAEADVFAMTSRYEGFPNALLEAMASGLPCVAMDCPSGPREMTENGILARLLPLGDSTGFVRSLCELIDCDTTRTELGMGARKAVAQKYQASTVLLEWDELFKRVVK